MVLKVFIESSNFSFFIIAGWGIDLDYHDIEWFVLETNRDHSFVFEIAPKYCILDSFVDYGGYSISSEGYLPTWSSELNLSIPVHFSSLTPKMSMFTLAISYLTTSNLSWFMDLTFQVPMQHCSLQPWTLLSSPVTSTTGCFFLFCFVFYFGSVSSFFLELFLFWSPLAY